MHFSFVVSGSTFQNDDLVSNETNVTCNPGFYVEDSTCFPMCQEWMLFSGARTLMTRIIIGASSLLATVTCVAVIVGYIIRYRTM